MAYTLNPEQWAAVQYLSGPLLVIAGAGSGKTGVISQKILHLIRTDICAPEEIVALSFTNKAAQEMADRLKHHHDKRTQKVITSTFHALGLQIIRQEHRALGLKSGFSLFDSQDVTRCIRDLFHLHEPSLIKDIQRSISLWKNQDLSPEDVAKKMTGTEQERYAIYYERYMHQMNRYHAIDFDDLILKPTRLFDTHPDIQNKWQNKIRYLLIDEYQDTSQMQYNLIKQLTYPRGALTAVGDDHQAIYGWRGANTENIMRLQHCYPHLKIIALAQNYRSTNKILGIANQLMEKSNHTPLGKKSLWSTRGDGMEPTLLSKTRHEEEQAQQVLMTLINHQREMSSPYGEYAILYRSNYQGRAIEAQLRHHHIPYTLSGGQSFFERMEIKDVCAYLRLIVNQDDDSAFLRAVQTPPHGISSKTLELLSLYASQRNISLFDACHELGFQTQVSAQISSHTTHFCQFISNFSMRALQEPASEILNDCIAQIRYEQYLYDHYDEKPAQERADNVQHFTQWIHKLCENSPTPYLLAQLLQKLMLIQMIQDKDHADGVHLSTIHAAKGLEYPYVFIIGCEEGTLPHKDNAHPEGLEEERRLMYVAVTRAQNRLWFAYCGKPNKETDISRFITDMGLQEKTEQVVSPTSQNHLKRIAALLNAHQKEEIPI